MGRTQIENGISRSKASKESKASNEKDEAKNLKYLKVLSRFYSKTDEETLLGITNVKRKSKNR